MTKIKDHLLRLERIGPKAKSRLKYLRLDMNENPCGLPESFMNTVLKEVDSGLLSAYPEYSSLENAIARHNQVLAKNIILANGSDSAIKYIFDAYVSAKDLVLLTDPTFAMYPVYCSMFAAEAITVKYNADLSFPFEGFMDRLNRGVKLAVIINPNNPCGSALSREKIKQILKKAKENNILVVIDEAYFYYYPDSVIEAINDFDNLIVLRTFSKLCGMAGLRLGYAAASSRVIGGLVKVRSTFDVNAVAALFAERLLENPDIIRGMVKLADEGKSYLSGMLSREGIGHCAGQANFVLIKCPGRVNQILEELSKNKILAAGPFSQDFLKDYIRVTVADKPAMKRFWAHFIRIWRNLPSDGKGAVR